MVQMAHYDNSILDLIDRNLFKVDEKAGYVYGKERSDGNRNMVGSVCNGSYKFSFVLNGKSISYPINRSIYLYVHKKISDGYEVYNIDGDMFNNKICNLDIKRASKETTFNLWWNEKDKKFLVENINKMSYSELSKYLGRSLKAIRHKIKKIKIKKNDRRRAWLPEDDKMLKKLYPNNLLDIKEIAKKMNKSLNSVRLRANRINGLHRSDRHLRDDFDIIESKNFYLTCKQMIHRGTLRSKCCLCSYNKYIEWHHIDCNHENNRVSNIASLCPNHHVEVQNGDHEDKILYAIWQRKYRDGTYGPVKSNLKLVKKSRR